MKSFVRHIEHLLIRNDYVIIPKFGGFVVQQQNSVIQDNTIIPPTVTVGFNSLLQNSDGLLEMEIARTEQIAYRQAVEIVEANVLKIKNLLLQNQKIDFGKIGKISLNNGMLFFLPTDNFQFLPANFGLQKVNFHFIDNKNNKGKKTITLTLYPKTMLRYAASVALIFGLLGIQPFLENKPQQAGFVNMLNNIKTASKVDSAKFITENQNIITEQAEFVTVEKIETGKNFHLIVGCFKTHTAAQKYANSLKNSKLEINIDIFYSANLQCVSAGSFAFFDDAKIALKVLKNSGKEFENVWIMRKKM